MLKVIIDQFNEIFDKRDLIKAKSDLIKAKSDSIYCGYMLEVYEIFKDPERPHQMLRFEEILKNYLSGGVEEKKLKSDPNVSLGEFLDIRFKVGFFDFWRLLSELCCKIVSSDEYENSFRWVLFNIDFNIPFFKQSFLKLNSLFVYISREINDSVVIINTLINDVFSFNKEVNAVKTGVNIISELQKGAKCSSAAAMEFVCHKLLEEMLFFDQSCNNILRKKVTGSLLSDPVSDLHNFHLYVTALKDFINANFNFCRFNKRYKIANDSAENL